MPASGALVLALDSTGKAEQQAQSSSVAQQWKITPVQISLGIY